MIYAVDKQREQKDQAEADYLLGLCSELNDMRVRLKNRMKEYQMSAVDYWSLIKLNDEVMKFSEEIMQRDVARIEKKHRDMRERRF